MIQNRYDSIDVLRFVLAAIVAINHFSFQAFGPDVTLIPSKLAVEIFFIVSGYVIAPQIQFVISHLTTRNIFVFLSRRMLRTIPAYFFALLLTCMVLVEWPSISKLLLYDYFLGIPEADEFAISWSLAVEEYSYIAVGFFLVFSFLIPKVYRQLGLLFFLMGIVLFAFIARSVLPINDEEARIATFFRADALVYGALVRQYCTRGSFRLGGIMVALGLMLMVSVEGVFVRYTLLAPAIFLSIGVFLVVLRMEGIFIEAKNISATGRWLGSLSYGIYLIHLPVVYGLSVIFTGYLLVLNSFFATVVVASFVKEFIEVPCLRLRPGYWGDAGAKAAS